MEGIDLVKKLRREVFDRHINAAKSSGLELGPHASPLVSRDEGPIKYADYLTKAQHIAADPVLGPLTPETDYVLTNNDYVSQIPETFDYVVANHVIEHAPNMIGFLRSLSKLVKPGGALFLAIPDKKFTFDKYRQNTTLAHVVHDWFTDPPMAGPEHMIELAMYYDKEFAGGTMNAQENLDPALMASVMASKPHIGMHCHVFQSETILQTLINPLCLMGYVPLSFLDFREARAEWGGEMLLMLRNTPSTAPLRSASFYDTRFSVVQ